MSGRSARCRTIWCAAACTLMTDVDHLVHVSGHPARDELRRLYRLVKPRYAVPTHGEWRHLSAHAALAQEAGAKPILLEDGDILNLAPGPARGGGQRAGRQAGAGWQPPDAARRRCDVRAAADAVQRRGAGEPGGGCAGQAAWRAAHLSAPGLFEPTIRKWIASARVRRRHRGSAAIVAADDEALTEAARAALRRALGRRLQKRPLVDVHLLRVERGTNRDLG